MVFGLAGSAAADPHFKLLHSFSELANDGKSPSGPLVSDADGNVLYGTTSNGGENDDGTVFKVKVDGNEFAVLHSFHRASSDDGAYPEGGLILDAAGNLYGTTNQGGANGDGTIYRVKTDGTGFALLHSFSHTSSADGANPIAGLIADAGGNLYGTTDAGGASFPACPFGCGSIFTIKTSGTGFKLLHSFSFSPTDGVGADSCLVLDGNGNLYGTTYQGGASQGGTVFRIKTSGSGFTLLHSFSFNLPATIGPGAGLILDAGGFLYGTTEGDDFTAGCGTACGTVFKMKSDGTGFKVLHTFSASSDGATTSAGVVADGKGNLYGTAPRGGANGGGTIFQVRTDGSGFAVLHAFPSSSADEGSAPSSELILDTSGNLYGTAVHGGDNDAGTVFKLSTASRAAVIPAPGSSLRIVGRR